MVHNPVLLEEGESLEEGCLPRSKYQLLCDRFSVINCGDVAIEVEALVNFVAPSRSY